MKGCIFKIPQPSNAVFNPCWKFFFSSGSVIGTVSSRGITLCIQELPNVDGFGGGSSFVAVIGMVRRRTFEFFSYGEDD